MKNMNDTKEIIRRGFGTKYLLADADLEDALGDGFQSSQLHSDMVWDAKEDLSREVFCYDGIVCEDVTLKGTGFLEDYLQIVGHMKSLSPFCEYFVPTDFFYNIRTGEIIDLDEMNLLVEKNVKVCMNFDVVEIYEEPHPELDGGWSETMSQADPYEKEEPLSADENLFLTKKLDNRSVILPKENESYTCTVNAHIFGEEKGDAYENNEHD